MPYTFDLSEAEPMLNNISDIFSPQGTTDILMVAGKKVGVAAEEIVQANLYPPASGKALPLFYRRTHESGPEKGKEYLSKFKSKAQQRLVMALVAQKKVPYRRTGLLGKSILSKPTPAGNGVVIVSIGSRLEYSIYVIDQVMQSHYHLGTWPTIQHDIEAGLPTLVNVAVKSVVDEVNRRVSGG